MTERDRRPFGYSIVLVGAVGFVVGCFLPYVTTDQFSPTGTPSIWQMSTGRSTAETLGAAWNLFPGSAVLVATAVWGIRKPQPWTMPALVATTVVWSFARMGGLAFSYSVYDGNMAVGYWFMLTCVVLVMIGAGVVFMSSFMARRRDDRLGEAG